MNAGRDSKQGEVRDAFARAEKRQDFYDGAQYLYTQHFTTCHPFPAKEVMREAIKRFPDPKELRKVTINGNHYRVNDNVIEIEVFPGEWASAVAITPEAVKVLADLIDNPYEASK